MGAPIVDLAGHLRSRLLRELRGLGLLAMGSFFLVLGAGYVYARARGALKWR